MKRHDWITNKAEAKTVDSETWAMIADEIVENLFEIPKYRKIEQGGKHSLRLMLGVAFYDVASHGLGDPPRPNRTYNIIGYVTEFNPKVIKIKIRTADTALAYEFTYKGKRLTRKQIK
jgi:hypothetical protein